MTPLRQKCEHVYTDPCTITTQYFCFLWHCGVWEDEARVYFVPVPTVYVCVWSWKKRSKVRFQREKKIDMHPKSIPSKSFRIADLKHAIHASMQTWKSMEPTTTTGYNSKPDWIHIILQPHKLKKWFVLALCKLYSDIFKTFNENKSNMYIQTLQTSVQTFQ